MLNSKAVNHKLFNIKLKEILYKLQSINFMLKKKGQEKGGNRKLKKGLGRSGGQKPKGQWGQEDWKASSHPFTWPNSFTHNY